MLQLDEESLHRIVSSKQMGSAQKPPSHLSGMSGASAMPVTQSMVNNSSLSGGSKLFARSVRILLSLLLFLPLPSIHEAASFTSTARRLPVAAKRPPV